MSKKAFGFLLTLLITASIILSSCLCALGESLPEEETEEIVLTEPDASQDPVYGSSPSEPLTTEPPATVSKAKFPVLSVSAISNYFGRIDAEYNEFTREVTVVYMMKSNRRLLSVDWTLRYDAELLTLDPKKNTLAAICPIMKNDAVMSVDSKKGVIRYNSTDMNMFDYTSSEAAFVQLVFDIPEFTPEDSEITKVDLSVNDLVVSEPDPQTGYSMTGRETVLVANEKVLKNSRTKKVQVSKYTTITPSTFSEAAVKPASGDEATTTTISPPTTQQPTEITQGTTAAPKPREPEKKEDEPLLYTGTWYIALLILVILLVCSTILFVMRKRDIYND